MGRKLLYKRVKYILILLLISFLFLSIIFLVCINIKNITKKATCTKIVEHRKELIEVVIDIKDIEYPELIHNYENSDYGVSYRYLNNDKITNIFHKFKLISIWKELNKKNRFTNFKIDSFASKIWFGYSYGFYYSDEDKAIDVTTGEECELYFDRENQLRKGWYRTEKIIDNWWYYEDLTIYDKSMMFNGY